MLGIVNSSLKCSFDCLIALKGKLLQVLQLSLGPVNADTDSTSGERWGRAVVQCKRVPF